MTQEVDTDITYSFTITERVIPDYQMASAIITWLKTNMESLTDDYNNSLFGKVNTGFSDDSLKTFGKKPVCDVYIDNVEYSTDFDDHKPDIVNSILICYLKGANNQTYNKACELHDYIMQEFIETTSFRRCTVVRDTYIRNSQVQVQPLQKKWGVIVAFELSHKLY